MITNQRQYLNTQAQAERFRQARIGSHQRKELERLCRYIARPAITNERLSRNSKGQVVLQLKSPYRDGTTHIVKPPRFSMCSIFGMKVCFTGAESGW